MTHKTMKELFASDIHRDIEEVIKVDQADEQILKNELAEYVVTDSLRGHFVEILEQYRETPNKPHEGVGVWVSGFFGSGKSSFAKYLGLALENRAILGDGAADLFARCTGDPKVEVLLRNITEHIPTDAVIFDVSTDRGIRTGNQTITEIMYRLFLQRLGYARDLDLSELEITLEGEGRLDEFKQTYHEVFAGKDWDTEKGKIATAVQQASRVMHELDPATYTPVESWRESALHRADITPGLLAERCKQLMARRGNGRSLVFVVDEVGQFVARDVQKMLDLQAVVQSLGRVGRGKMWLVITSQEKLTELVGGLDNTRVELARLMDRFPLQVMRHGELNDAPVLHGELDDAPARRLRQPEHWLEDLVQSAGSGARGDRLRVRSGASRGARRGRSLARASAAYRPTRATSRTERRAAPHGTGQAYSRRGAGTRAAVPGVGSRPRRPRVGSARRRAAARAWLRRSPGACQAPTSGPP